MSVELLGECKRKLLGSVGKLDKIMEMYDSSPLEKCLHESCKADAVIKETRDQLAKHRNEYQKSTLR
jgi:hypothetical protein